MLRYAPPVHRSLWALTAAALLGTLLTDIQYWRTADFPWVDASDWLVTAGVIVGLLALIAALVEAFAFHRRYAPSPAFAVAAVCVWVVAVVDMFVHTRDSWTSVVPWGLALSALSVLALVVAYWIARVGPPFGAQAIPAEPAK